MTLWADDSGLVSDPLTDIQHELHAVVGGEVENILHILKIIKILK